MSTPYDDIADLMPAETQKKRVTGRPTGPTDAGRREVMNDLDRERSRNEAIKADLNELKFKQEAKEWISRVAVRQASATAIQAFTQTVRSIPDNLERNLGISPEVAAETGRMIDAALESLANEFELMSGAD